MKVKAPELKLLGVSNPDSVDIEITARRNGIIEIFKGNGKLNEATEYIRSVFIDSPVAENEIRTITARVPKNLLGSSKQYIIATLTDLQKNTSQFSNVLSSFSDGNCVVTDVTDKDVSGSLRAAIRCANFANNGKPVISFAIPGTDPKEIKLLTPLPKVQNIFGDSVVIDASTQASYIGNVGDATVMLKNDVNYKNDNNVEAVTFYKTRIKSLNADGLASLIMYNGGVLEAVNFKNFTTVLSGVGSEQFYLNNVTMASNNQILTSQNYPKEIKIVGSLFSSNNQISINPEILIIDNCQILNTNIPVNQALNSSSKYVTITNSKIGGYLSISSTDLVFNNNNLGCFSGTAITSTCYLAAETQMELKNNTFGNATGSDFLNIGPLGNSKPKITFDGNYFGQTIDKSYNCPITPRAIYGYGSIDLDLTNNHFFNIDSDAITYYDENTRQKVLNIKNNEFGSLLKPIKGDVLKLIGIGMASLTIQENIFEGNTVNSSENNDAIDLTGTFINAKINENTFKQTGRNAILISSGSFEINNNQFNNIGNDGIVSNVMVNMILKNNTFTNVSNNGLYISSRATVSISDGNNFKNINNYGVYSFGYGVDLTIKGNIFENCKIAALRLDSYYSNYEVSSNNIFKNNTRAITSYGGLRLIEANTFESTNPLANNDIYLHYANFGGSVIGNIATALDNTPGSFINFADNDRENALVKGNIITGYATSAIEIKNGVINKKISRNILDHATKAINLDKTSSTPGNANKPTPQFISVEPTIKGYTVKGNNTNLGDSVEIFLCNTRVRQKTNSWLLTKYVDKADGSWEVFVPFEGLPTFDIIALRATATKDFNTSELSEAIELPKITNGVCIVNNTSDNEIPGSLRAAVRCANYANNGKPVISFAIDGAAAKEIKLLTELPVVKNFLGDSVVIDGSTQALYSGNLGDPTIRITNDALFVSAPENSNVMYKVHLKKIQAEKISNIKMFEGGELDGVDFTDVITYCKTAGSRYYIKQSSFNSGASFYNPYITSNSDDIPNGMLIKNCSFNGINNSNQQLLEINVDDFKMYNTTMSRSDFGQLFTVRAENIVLNDNTLLGYFLAYKAKNVSADGNNIGCSSNALINKLTFIEASESISLKNNAIGGANSINGYQLRLGNIGTNSVVELLNNTFGYSTKDNTSCPINANGIHSYTHKKLTLTNNSFRSVNGNMLELLSVKENIISGNTFGSYTDPIKDYSIFINGGESSMVSGNNFYSNGVKNGGIIVNEVPLLTISGNQFDGIGKNAIELQNNIKGTIDKVNTFKNITENAVYLNGTNTTITAKGNHFENCLLGAIYLNASNSGTQEISGGNTFVNNKKSSILVNCPNVNISENVFTNNKRALNGNSTNLTISSNTFTATTDSNAIYFNTNGDGNVISNTVTALDVIPGSFLNFAPSSINTVLVKRNNISGYANSAISVTNEASNKKISRNILDHATKAININYNNSITILRGNGNKQAPTLSTLVPNLGLGGGLKVDISATIGDSVEVFLTELEIRSNTSKWIGTVYMDKAIVTYVIPAASFAEFTNIVGVRATATSGYNTSELSNLLSYKLNCTAIVTNTNDVGTGSLREAITCAYFKTEDVAIDFNFNSLVPTPYEIKLATTLPTVFNSYGKKVAINGLLGSGNSISITLKPANNTLVSPAMTLDANTEVKNIAIDYNSTSTTNKSFTTGLVLKNGATADNMRISYCSGTGVSCAHDAGMDLTKSNILRSSMLKGNGTGLAPSGTLATNIFFQNNDVWAGAQPTGLVANAQYGIYLNNNSLNHNLIVENSRFGIEPVTNAVSGLSVGGIYFGTGTNSAVDDLIKVTGSYFAGNKGYQIFTKAKTVVIENNYLGYTSSVNGTSTVDIGIGVAGTSKECTIRNNKITKVTNTLTPYAISLETTSLNNSVANISSNKIGFNNDVRINTKDVTSQGIRLFKSQFVNVDNNKINNGGFGIYAENISGALGTHIYTNNTITNSQISAITTKFQTAANISNNTISFESSLLQNISRDAAIRLVNVNSSTLNTNTITNHPLQAIVLDNSSNNQIKKGVYSTIIKSDIASLEFLNNSKSNIIEEEKYTKSGPVCVSIKNPGIGNVLTRTTLFSESANAITLAGGNGNRVAPIITSMQLRGNKIRLRVKATAKDIIEVFESSPTGTQLNKFLFSYTLNSTEENFDFDVSSLTKVNDFYYIRVTATSTINGTSKESNLAKLCPTCTCIVKNTSDHEVNSLREAITRANAGECGNINFEIPNQASPYLISLETVLPKINLNVNIDGTTQLGYNTVDKKPIIWLQTKDRVSPLATGLDFASDQIKIKAIGLKKFVTAINIITEENELNTVFTANTVNENVVIKTDISLINGSTFESCKFGTDELGTEIGSTTKSLININGIHNRFNNCAFGKTAQNNVFLTGIAEKNTFTKGSFQNSLSVPPAAIFFNSALVQKNKLTPAITKHEYIGNNLVISGTCQSSTDLIQLYLSNGKSQNATKFLTDGIAGSGNWSLTLNALDYSADESFSFIATATDVDGNTSRLSSIYATGFYVCFVTTNAETAPTGKTSLRDAIACVNSVSVKSKIEFRLPVTNNLSDLSLIFNSSGPALTLTNSVGVWIDGFNKIFDAQSKKWINGATPNSITLKKGSLAPTLTVNSAATTVENLKFDAINLTVSKGNNHKILKNEFLGSTLTFNGTSAISDIKDNKFSLNGRVSIFTSKQIRISKNIFQAQTGSSRSILLNLGANNNYAYPVISFEDAFAQQFYLRLKAKAGDTLELFSSCDKVQCATKLLGSYVIDATGTMVVPFNYADFNDLSSPQYFTSTARDKSGNTSELSTTYTLNTCIVSSNLDYTPPALIKNTLRSEITNANLPNGCSVISFRIPSGMSKEIQLKNSLPPLTKLGSVINAASQAGFINATNDSIPQVTIKGISLGGLSLSGYQKVNGLVFDKMATAIAINNSNNSKISYCDFKEVRTGISISQSAGSVLRDNKANPKVAGDFVFTNASFANGTLVFKNKLKLNTKAIVMICNNSQDVQAKQNTTTSEEVDILSDYLFSINNSPRFLLELNELSGPNPGISLTSSTSSKIINNRFSKTSNSLDKTVGCSVISSEGSTVELNTFSGTPYMVGIISTGNKVVNINDNILGSVSDAGIYYHSELPSSNPIIKRNTIVYKNKPLQSIQAATGITALFTVSATNSKTDISENNISGNEFGPGLGISAENAPGSIVKNNTIKNFTTKGIDINEGLGSVLVSELTLNKIFNEKEVIDPVSKVKSFVKVGLGTGIYVSSTSPKVKISGNSIYNCATAMEIQSNGNEINANTIGNRDKKISNNLGIVLLGNNNVLGKSEMNTITETGKDGKTVTVTRPSYLGNTIMYNSEGGIQNKGQQNKMVYNIFIHNEESENVPNHLAIDNVNANNANDNISRPYAISYTRGTDPTLISITGKARANSNIHAYTTNGFPQDALVLMGETTSDGNGNWSLNITESANQTKTTYLVATATDVNNNTSELSKMLAIGNCYISNTRDLFDPLATVFLDADGYVANAGTSVLRDNEFPLEGTTRAAAVCANMAPEKATILTHVSGDTKLDVPLTGLLPTLTNSKGFDWSGKNRAYTSPTEFYLRLVPKDITQPLAYGLEIEIPDGVPAKLAKNKFAGLQTAVQIKSGKLSIEKAVVERNVSDKELMPTGTGSSFVNVLKTAAFSTLDAPTLNNVKAYDLDRIIQTDFAKLSSITIGGNSEFWNVVSAFNNADKEVGSITITDTKWHNVGNYWINAAKVETFSLDKDTLDGNQKDTKKVLEIAEVETSYITNCVFTDTVKSSLSTLSYILLPKANTSTIIGNSFNLRSHEQAIQLYSISRADLFENQYVNLLGNGIKISGKNISLQNEHFTTKGHAIIGESLADVIIKKCEIKLLKNTGTNVANGIYLTKSSNVIMESNLIQGNNDETKAINIKRDDVNLQSNGGKITPYGLKVQTIWKNGGPFDENTPWPSTPPLPVRIVSGEAESNDVIELFISGKTIPSDLQDPSANKEADTKEIIVERTTADANGHWEWEIPKNWNRAPDELFITVTGTGKNTTLNKGTSELSKLLLISALDVKCIVKNRDDAGPGSLRNAFNCVNGTDFRAEVIFDIQDAAVNNEQVIVLSSYLPEIYNYSGFDIKGATQPRNERIVVTMPSAMTPTTADPESKFGINVKPFCGDSTKLSDLTLRGFPKGIELNTGQAKLDNIVIEMPGSFTPPVLDSDWKGLVAISQKQVTGDKDPVATDKYPVTDKVVRTKTCTISGYKVGWDATKDLSDETSNDVNLASIKLVNNNFDHVGVGVKLPLILTKTKIEGNCFKNVYESGILFETNSASDGNEFLNNWFGVEKIGEAPTQGTHMNNAFKLRGVSSTLFKGNHIYALSEPTTNENGAGFYLYGIDAANAPANTFPPADRNSSPIEYTSRNNIFVENNIGWSNALKDVLNENKTSLSIGFSQAGVYAFSNSYVNNSVANIGTAVKIHNGAFDKISGNHFGHYQVIETDKPPVDKYLPINGNAIEFFESTEELVASNIIGNYGESSNGISISSSSTKPILTITKNTIRSGNELAGKGISYNKTEIIPVFTERAVLDNQYIKLLIDHTAKDGKIEVFTAPSPVVPGTPGPKISFSILGNKQQSLVYVGDAENLSNGKWEIKIFKDHFSLKDASYFVASYTTPGGNSSEFGTVSINNLLCDMTISLIPSYQVCPGITTKLNSGFEDKTLDYKWEQKSGSSYSTKPDFISPWNADTSFIASVKDKGDFRLTISDQAVSPNCSVSKDFSFTHYTAPSTPDFLVNKTGYVNEPLIILDNTKPIAANSTKEVTVWDWGLANLKPSTTVILPTTVSPGDVGKYQAITYPNSGKYTISQKITHDNQCSFSAKKEITIINREQGDKGDQTIPLVGAVMENFQMYPNPFTRGSVNPIISFETNLEPKPFSIYISRVQDGVALQRLDFTKKDLELVNGIYKFQYSVLGFNTLPGGVYVVRVEMENDVKTVRQIVN
ncbi:MAG: right-handed parallel beta-helix repeat-containing protein [Bacteroidia bacterium]|nr:right-handed parallel beta-helix repeat-containing protein [Bacteroidia bacterium]